MTPGDGGASTSYEAHPASDRVHLFVVVREDLFQRTPSGWSAGTPSSLGGIRAYWDGDEALRESERLNQVNGPKGCHYHVLIVRMSRAELAKAPPPEPPA